MEGQVRILKSSENPIEPSLACDTLENSSDNSMELVGHTRLATVAVCSINQWALDFSGNYERILSSVKLSKSKGARLRVGSISSVRQLYLELKNNKKTYKYRNYVLFMRILVRFSGPELEICGYSCEDHFLEGDTVEHSWEILGLLLSDDTTDGIICDFGMPVIHDSVLYNCRVLALNRKILLIRPKCILAGYGNYREMRYFTEWKNLTRLEKFLIPSIISQKIGQKAAPFGVGIISCLDARIAAESCEELWAPQSMNINLSFNGVEIFCNGSASHHELRKLSSRLSLIKSSTCKNGGVYLYSNQRGCDGNRVYFDGSSLIVLNGEVVNQGIQFSLEDVEVLVSTVDLDEVTSHRVAAYSYAKQAVQCEVRFPVIETDFSLCKNAVDVCVARPINVKLPIPEEEIAFGPACWLWDYLRRSQASGFFIPLSGGADSSAVAAIVGSMCQLIEKAINLDENPQVLADLERIIGISRHSHLFPRDAKEICYHLLHTCYLRSNNSSISTSDMASNVAANIGSYHLQADIEIVINAIINFFVVTTHKVPRFLLHGGTMGEDLALQNLQARSRMTLSYLLASLLPWVRGKKGWLLVLATGNVDECLKGYLTKYDCSSGDLNPIGSISKEDLKRFLLWASRPETLGYEVLQNLENVVPTAELRPITSNFDRALQHSQTDEADMGLSYSELSAMGKLRKVDRLGPVGMFRRLVYDWKFVDINEIARKVKIFFTSYARNRHKMVTMTPSYHAESYNPDDNRFDLRPFLYPSMFFWQYQIIDRVVRSRKVANG